MNNDAGINRLESGGLIDRDNPLSFTFNGAKMRGFAGDSVASALLANNVRIVARSFKYHRPRGIYGIGAEEPNAIFTIADQGGGRRTPNMRATLTTLTDGMRISSQSGFPSVHFDIGALFGAASRLLPAGFYYKTFMWPPKLWMFYEKLIRRAAPCRQTFAAHGGGIIFALAHKTIRAFPIADIFKNRAILQMPRMHRRAAGRRKQLAAILAGDRPE